MSKTGVIRLAAAFTALLFLARPAYAGMPSPPVLTDLGRYRIESVSFFLLIFLLCAAAIRLLWNYLQRDFPRLPRLTYPKALALTFIWGLLFVVVLTMISGARELLTPGAWEHNGATYKLKQQGGGQ